MKKLGAILLAIMFVFGLATQASAAPSEIPESAFIEDEPITFTNIARGVQITIQFPGVEFSDGLYGEDYFSLWFMADTHTGSNINLYNFSQQPEAVITVNFIEPVTRVGFDAASPSGEVIVTIYRDGAQTGTIIGSASSKTFIGMEDPEGIDAIDISGNGYFSILNNVLFIDNFRFGGVPETGPAEIEVTMNVKPPNCLGASINMNSQGVTPVVIAGSEDFDVTKIDSSSLRLLGVAPVRTAIEDVPLCGSPESDGFLDLTLKFDTQELVQAMGASLVKGQTLEDGSWLPLQVNGSLLEEWGGTPIKGEDTVTLVGKGKNKKENNGKGKK